ncbi:hypothetical protein ACNHUS_01590 [Actinomycetes bacterium M1A6_2h]
MTERPDTKKRPSVLLLLAGIAAMVVSVSALIQKNPVAALSGVQAGWIAVGSAVLVGLVLVLAPVRRRYGR